MEELQRSKKMKNNRGIPFEFMWTKKFNIMKTAVFVFFILCTLYIFSCKNNNTTTQMPDSGYKARTDSVTASDTIKDLKDRGAVGLDSVSAGQAPVSGATKDSTKK